MPEGAVYVGRPSLFGNPWTMRDASDIPAENRRAWCVAQYRTELTHGGLLSDWAEYVSEARYDEMCARWDALEGGPPDPTLPPRSIVPLFRHLLRGATALVCWCPLDQPCHADVLIELLAAPA